MKINNENIKAIIVNIVSSIIFQIILLFVSSSGVVYTLNKVKGFFIQNSVTISVFTLIILVLSCIVVTTAIFLLLKSINRRRNKKKENYVGKIEDYYFSEYEKHITIYQNGNGIIIHKFKVVANDISKLQKIRRKLNIEDGVKTSHFPSLKEMMQTNKANRFKDFGFWYSSEDNVISEVKEFYWDSKTPNENKKLKNNPQEIRWIFKMDKNKLKKEKPYEICYVISVPGLAALKDGSLDKNLLNDPLEEISSSNMHIDHKIQKLKYTISFEDGVSIDVPPKCKCIISEQDGVKELDIPGIEDYDLLYKKYIFSIENPVFGSEISISWKYNMIQ